MDSMQKRDGGQRLVRELLAPQQMGDDRNGDRDEPGERPWKTKTHASSIPQELKQRVLRRSVSSG